MYHSILHTTGRYNGKKIIIDLAERNPEYNSTTLLHTVYRQFELMAMYPNGKEIESFWTDDRQEAEKAYNDMVDKYTA